MKAMILAAGVGSRLRPLTENRPKPLLTVHGKALIVYHIEKLVAIGITDLVINTSYLAEMIWDTLKDGREFGANIRYSHETDGPLETAGGVIQALSILGDEPFLLVNSDVWTDYPFNDLNSSLESGYLAHLVMVKNPHHHLEGDFYVSKSMESKVQYNVSAKSVLSVGDDTNCISDIKYTFAGISMIHPELFTGFNAGKLPLKPVFEAAMVKQQVSGEIYGGIWCDVGTPERLKMLNKGI